MVPREQREVNTTNWAAKSASESMALARLKDVVAHGAIKMHINAIKSGPLKPRLIVM